jgi:predicted SnoaL-like aldol condensation-catalyzing enzyme
MDAQDIVRIRDGQVSDHWGVLDAMKMMQRLAAPPEQAPA